MELAAILIVSGVGLLGWAAWSGRKPPETAGPADLSEAKGEDTPERVIPFIPLRPGPQHQPDETFESVVAGVNHSNPDGGDRQAIIADLSVGDALCLVRDYQHEVQDEAVAVFTEDGRHLGYLPEEIAPQIAGILDRKRPVLAEITAIEPFGGRTHQGYLGLKLRLTAYRKVKNRRARRARSRAAEHSAAEESDRTDLNSSPK